jgi:hypothetical protein
MTSGIFPLNPNHDHQPLLHLSRSQTHHLISPISPPIVVSNPTYCCHLSSNLSNTKLISPSPPYHNFIHYITSRRLPSSASCIRFSTDRCSKSFVLAILLCYPIDSTVDRIIPGSSLTQPLIKPQRWIHPVSPPLYITLTLHHLQCFIRSN